MKVNLISADIPLCKNLKTGESYPNVYRVTSRTEEVNTLQELHQVLVLASRNGEALLTGRLKRQLINESRAGQTEAEPTQLFVLDVDNDELPYSNRDEMLRSLGLNADYIYQYSAKAKVNSLRGHYFFMLDQEQLPEQINDTIKSMNVEHLYYEIKLSQSTRGVSWPLDIGVNNQGRIIYLAPPVMDVDPIPERILKPTGEKLLTLPKLEKVNTTTLLTELRGFAGLKPVDETRAKDEIRITGIKENDNFVYLNLNGGDSWGYYFLKENPTKVKNFKEEPNLYLNEIAPDLYKEYAPSLPIGGEPLVIENGELKPKGVAGFRDPAADLYYQVLYDTDTNIWSEYYVTNSKPRMNDFLMSRGADPKKICPDGNVYFDPSNLSSFEPETLSLNLYRPTEYLLITETQPRIPPMIEGVIRHVLVSDECYEHFLNWLAFIFQTRKKTGTAWLFHGVQGTGKGTLYHDILVPIFGTEHCWTGNLEVASEMYNEHMRKNMIMMVDEFNIKDSNDASNRIWNKLKTYISEPTIQLRPMRSRQMTVDNFSNFIFTTNEQEVIKIDESERRLNIAPRQELQNKTLINLKPLLVNELEAFSRFLKGFKVNENKARTIILTEARLQAIKNSRNSIDDLFFALRSGDLDFFADQILEDPDWNEAVANARYRTIIDKWAANEGKESIVPNDDLFEVYKFLCPGNKTARLKFDSLCRKMGMPPSRQHVNGRKQNVYKITFKGDIHNIPANNNPGNVVKLKP